MIKQLRLGILISGRGSNMEALVQGCLRNEFPAGVACVISDNPKALGLSIAESYGIRTFVVPRGPLDTGQIDTILRENKVDLVCLAGFMSILPEEFVRKWPTKVINIHPSLLPSFKGLKAQEQALNAGVRIAGCTIHYVSPELDAGPIIVQGAVPVVSCDTVETLSERILSMEHKCYPEAIRLISLGRIEIIGDTVKCVDGDRLCFFSAT